MKQILLMIGMVTLVGCGEPKVTPSGDRQPMPKDFKSLKTWAEKGDAEAQSNLGVMYDTGEGVEQDFKEAVYWYQKAADQGYELAQSNLGFMYERGRGVEQDFKEAFKWYQKAADQGEAGAQYNLGQMYRFGQGVKQDFKGAVKLYQKAADQGFALAQKALGLMYGDGVGVEQNDVTAYAWWNIATTNGNQSAKNIKSVIAGRMTPSQIAEAAALAKEMVKKNPKLLK